jgi:transglutaminase-like putative cysteine protease
VIASDRSGIAVVISIFLATFTVSSLTQDRSFLGVSWLFILLLGGVSLALRRARLGAGAVAGVQVLIWAGFVVLLAAGMPGKKEAWYEHLTSLWAAGIQHMQTQAAPMDPNDGVKLIFVTVIGAIMIVTDMLVLGIGRPVWAIAPPAAMFLVPAVGLATDTGVFSFACIALGYLAILVAEGLNSTARWTRGLSHDSAQGYGTANQVVWRAAGYIGGPALVLTVILGTIVPTLSLSGIGFGSGPGGNGPLQLTDPTLDLRRNLTQPQDKPVIEYKTDSPNGSYLRMASLPQFNASGWANIPMRLGPGEQLPAIPGVSAEPTPRHKTTISVLDFKSEYMPLPFAPRVISARGNWAYDPNSLVVLSMARGDRASALRNLTYSVDSVDITPSSDDLANAVAGTPADSSVTALIPPDLPDSLIALTKKVTAGQTTQALQAAAIQAFLRSDTFTYSTQTLPGSGYQALENFLLKDHKGYCEQFATSMAMMARVMGIPSRVAVGFLPGERKGDHWEVTIRDMHAWPELFFAGLGWVRFEPTPASVTGSAPAWTVPNEQTPENDPSNDPSSSASSKAPTPTAGPSAPVSQQPNVPGAGSTFPLGKTLLGSGIGLLALLIVAAPATVRRRRRTSRLTGVGPAGQKVEGTWEEIRDTVLDYGGTWPSGSPRVIGNKVSERLPAPESDAMSQVATLVERSRYARAFEDEEATRQLPEMVQDIRRGLSGPLSWWRKTRAFVVPRSLFRRRR